MYCHPKASHEAVPPDGYHSEEDSVLAICRAKSAEVPPAKSALGEGDLLFLLGVLLWLYTPEDLVRNPLTATWCWLVQTRRSGTQRLWWERLEAQLLPPLGSQEGAHPSLPKGVLGYARKWNILSQRLVKVEPLPSLRSQSHARHSVLYFSNDFWLSHTGSFCRYYSFLHSQVLFSHKDQSCHTTSSPNVLVLSAFRRNCCKLCNPEIIWAAVVLQPPTRGKALESLMNLNQMTDAWHFFLCLLRLCRWQRSQRDYPRQA